jgi:hypothetical protein
MPGLPIFNPADDHHIRNKDVKSGVSDSMNIQSKPPAARDKPRTRAPIWPWIWLALTGVATVGWLCGLAWAAVALAQWL